MATAGTTWTVRLFFLLFLATTSDVTAQMPPAAPGGAPQPSADASSGKAAGGGGGSLSRTLRRLTSAGRTGGKRVEAAAAAEGTPSGVDATAAAAAASDAPAATPEKKKSGLRSRLKSLVPDSIKVIRKKDKSDDTDCVRCTGVRGGLDRTKRSKDKPRRDMRSGTHYPWQTGWVILTMAVNTAVGCFGTLYLQKYSDFGFKRVYGEGVSANTDAFLRDNYIEITAYFTLASMEIYQKIREKVMDWITDHMFHGNTDSVLKSTDAWEIMRPEFEKHSLQSFIRTEMADLKDVSFSLMREGLAEYDPQHPYFDVAEEMKVQTGDVSTDVCIDEKTWMEPHMDTMQPDLLRVFIRFYYVTSHDARQLRFWKYGKYQNDDEYDLLANVWRMRARLFQIRHYKQILKREYDQRVHNIVRYDFDKFGDHLPHVEPKSTEWIRDMTSTLQKEATVEEIYLRGHLNGTWANLKRRSDHEAYDQGGRDCMAEAQSWVGFILIFVGLLPAIRTFNAADPHCVPLAKSDGSIVQGLARHGWHINQPLPTIYNGVTWSCGSDERNLIASAISCSLQCLPGYDAIQKVSYCRNIGGAGTEHTHLMAVEGLPGSHHFLDTPACCVSSSSAALLKQVSVNITDDIAAFWWTAEQGFAHSCETGRARLTLSACRVDGAYPMSDELKQAHCDDACADTTTTPTTLAACATTDVSLANPDWATLEKIPNIGNQDPAPTDAEFKLANRAAVYIHGNQSKIGQVNLPTLTTSNPSSSSSSSSLFYRITLTDSIYTDTTVGLKPAVGPWMP